VIGGGGIVWLPFNQSPYISLDEVIDPLAKVLIVERTFEAFAVLTWFADLLITFR
jgi:hypothetical protein